MSEPISPEGRSPSVSPPEREGTVGLHNALIRPATNEFAYLPEEYRLDRDDDGRVMRVHDLTWHNVDEPCWQPIPDGTMVSIGERAVRWYPRAVRPKTW